MKDVDVREFREMGLLHELNRLFLNPLGMAMVVRVEPVLGTEHVVGIQQTDDPKGIVLEELDKAKMSTAKKFMDRKHTERETTIGFIIQENNYPKEVLPKSQKKEKKK